MGVDEERSEEQQREEESEELQRYQQYLTEAENEELQYFRHIALECASRIFQRDDLLSVQTRAQRVLDTAEVFTDWLRIGKR